MSSFYVFYYFLEQGLFDKLYTDKQVISSSSHPETVIERELRHFIAVFNPFLKTLEH